MRNIFLFLTIFFFAIKPVQAAPAMLEIKTFDGKIFNLQENRNKIIIINFWASWCINCLQEMEILNDLYRDFHSQGLEIIGVSIDEKNARKEAIKVASRNPYKNGILLDAKENNFPEIEALPTSYILDKNGNIVKKILMEDEHVASKNDFIKIIEPLLLDLKNN